MMRDLILLFSKRYPIVKALDSAMVRDGFRVMVLLRLCPIIPFNGLNYIGGVTAISIEEYTKALVGILPTIVLWVFIGASADSIVDRTADDETEQLGIIILLCSGIAFAIIAIILIWKFAMKELKKELELDNAESWFKYKKSPSTELERVDSMKAEPEDSIEATHKGFHLPGTLALLGIGESGIETRYLEQSESEEERGEEWFWVWT